MLLGVMYIYRGRGVCYRCCVEKWCHFSVDCGEVMNLPILGQWVGAHDQCACSKRKREKQEFYFTVTS